MKHKRHVQHEATNYNVIIGEEPTRELTPAKAHEAYEYEHNYMVRGYTYCTRG